MKIAFINPGKGYHQPPLALGYLASYLRKFSEEKHEIRIFDENVNDDALKLTLRFKPDFIGITATTPTIPHVLKLATDIKSEGIEAPICVGGPHITALPETLMHNTLDIGVIGEGERTVLELVNRISDGAQIKEKGIAGVAFRKGNKLVITEARSFISDLNEIPMPARDLMKMNEFYCRPKETLRGIVAKTTQMMSSRGCPFNCVFCSNKLLWNQRVRLFSPEYVINEMEYLIDTYKLDGIYFQDDTFTANTNWFEQVCNLMIEQKLNKRVFWVCQAQATTLTPEKAELLKRAGCVRAEFGFESGSPRILQYLKRGASNVERNAAAIKTCTDAGLMVLGNFIFGVPGETLEDMQLSRKFYTENRIDYVSTALATPYPGTELWDYCKTNGTIKPEQVDWNKFFMGQFLDNIIINDSMPREQVLGEYSKIKDETDRINNKQKKVYFPTKSLSDFAWFLGAKFYGKLPMAVQGVAKRVAYGGK